MITKLNLQTSFDTVAMSLAGICGVHCLLMPVVLIAFPLLGTTLFVDENFHLWMLFAVIPTTAIAVFLGCRKHKDRIVIALSVTGLLLLITGIIYGHYFATGACPHCGGHHHDTETTLLTAESWLTTFGGVVMVSAHWRNWRKCRKSNCNHDHDSCSHNE